MCGIAGKIYFDESKKVEEGMIQKMTEALSHRGPDDSGAAFFASVGLGQRRLSIVDLSPLGHQPMYDTERKLCIVFNGEIYNYPEIRKTLEKEGSVFVSHSDTEAILHLYKKYGVECLKFLRGMFAFALWDLEKQELFVARDRVGKKPLKYFCDGKTFIFASELKALLTQEEVKKEIDFDAIDAYLSFGFVPEPRTGFQNIFKLEAGHFLRVSRKGIVEKTQYWDIDYSKKLNCTESEWLLTIEEKLKESVKLRLMSDVPLGAHLSGGVDSSLVVAMMAGEMKEPVKTFSVGFGEKEYNELPYARLVAEKYGTDHHECIMTPSALEILPKLIHHYEEPYSDASAIPTWYLSEYTKKEVTVALNGDGGDENFAGYRRFQAVKIFEKMRHVPFQNLFGNSSHFLYQKTHIKYFERLSSFFDSGADNSFDFYLSVIDVFGGKEKQELFENPKGNSFVCKAEWKKLFEKTKNWTTVDQFLFLHMKTSLVDDLLAKVDIGAMAHAVEVRSPFLDHEFLELTAHMPDTLKLHHGSKKYILKKLAEKYIPKECIYRKKQGFSVPLDFWFRGELFSFLKERLLDPKFFSYGFKKEKIEKLINDHKEFRADASDRLYNLLMLRLWLQYWFE